MKILAFTRYERLGASSRLRILQYLEFLESKKNNINFEPLIDNNQLIFKYETGRYGAFQIIASYIKRLRILFKSWMYDILWIEKELFPWVPAWIELVFLKNKIFILDYDDAIFLNYNKSKFPLVTFLYGKKIDILMFRSSLVVCGNEYLKNRAVQAGANSIKIIPTVVDLKRYPVTFGNRDVASDKVSRIVWIGSPSTAVYLNLLRKPLRLLSDEFEFKLRVIGAFIEMDGVDLECYRWDEDSEVKLIAECCIGIMPLFDSEWERGKCGYKLIQYMACGLPLIGSPVGVNCEIMQNGYNGFLATNSDEWYMALRILMKDKIKSNKMGERGRHIVENQYSLDVTGPVLFKEMQNILISK